MFIKIFAITAVGAHATTKSVFFVRHGESEWNARVGPGTAARCEQMTNADQLEFDDVKDLIDAPLTPQGIDDAQNVSKTLQRLIEEGRAASTRKPAQSAALRAMFMPVAPSPKPQPAITSSTSCGSIFALWTACSMACPNIAAPCVLLKPPRKDLARPVRAVEAMTTVRAAIGSETARRQRRSGKGCGDCGERGSASFLERCASPERLAGTTASKCTFFWELGAGSTLVCQCGAS